MFQRVRNHSKVRMFLDGRFPVQMLLLSRDTEQVRVNNVREKLRPQFQQKFDQWPQVVCKPTSRSLVDRELAKTFGQGFVMMNDLRAVFGGACAGTIVVVIVVVLVLSIVIVIVLCIVEVVVILGIVVVLVVVILGIFSGG
uniref:Uncharacterized protein n=1 Tax=Cacopsylla melanoneura TaxID=428564 RepID=A0A8D8UFB2_9HEMI